MSSEAIDIMQSHLEAQLGETGIFTEEAIFDPSGLSETIYGIFDDATYRENKDSANVFQKITGPRFVVANDLSINVYENKELHLVKRDRTYTIDYIDTDEQGMQVIWLRG
jgi:hypothetical protein